MEELERILEAVYMSPESIDIDDWLERLEVEGT